MSNKLKFKTPSIDPDFEDLVPLFLKTFEEALIQINTGFKEKKHEDIRGACHSLLGSVGTLGFIELEDMVKEVHEKVRKNSLDDLDKKVDEINQYYVFLKNQVKNLSA